MIAVDSASIKLSNLLKDNCIELNLEGKNKTEIIATFLAVLELIRLKEIVVVQKRNFSDIEIIRNEKHRLSAAE